VVFASPRRTDRALAVGFLDVGAFAVMPGPGLEVRTAEAIANHLGFAVELKRKGTVSKRSKRQAKG